MGVLGHNNQISHLGPLNEEHSIGGARPQRKSAEWERPGAGTADRIR
jgi:hypothetical protein